MNMNMNMNFEFIDLPPQVKIVALRRTWCCAPHVKMELLAVGATTTDIGAG